MQIPLNVIHYYVGIPIMIGLAVETYRRSRKRTDQTTYYLFMSFTYFAISLIAFGVPALFTHDNFRISVGTFIGDCTQTVAMLFFWLICIKAYLTTHPVLRRIALVFFGLLAISIMVEAIPRNLTAPYSTHFIHSTHNGVALTYADTAAFKIMSGINSLSLFFMGILFWQQASSAPTRAQKWRIRSLAIAALFTAFSFTISPAMPLEKQLWTTAILMTLGFLTVITTALISPLLKDKPSATA